MAKDNGPNPNSDSALSSSEESDLCPAIPASRDAEPLQSVMSGGPVSGTREPAPHSRSAFQWYSNPLLQHL